jgi:hypothetical protein
MTGLRKRREGIPAGVSGLSQRRDFRVPLLDSDMGVAVRRAS